MVASTFSVLSAHPSVNLKETRPQSERESLPWKREEIDGERSIAGETKEIDSKGN